jgi:predicted MFS family arabinose efflux permease
VKRPVILAVGALAATQLIGWGTTFQVAAVLGPAMGGAVGLPLAAVLFGPTIMLVVMAFASPFLPRAATSFGMARTMAAGSALAAAALLVLASAAQPAAFLAAWALLGLAGTAVLTTPAQIALAAIAGDGARRALGVLMLIAGLSSSLFWPVAAALEAWIGWRETLVVFAALHLAVCAPLHLTLPHIPPAAPAPGKPEARRLGPPTGRRIFVLLAGAISLNGFISWGFALTLIALFEARGLGRAEAVTAASAMGLVQIAARAVDFAGGARWNGLTTTIAAGVLLASGLVVLLIGTGTTAVIAFVLLYGTATGALAVARATLPLVFFPGDAYAAASARLALPLNLAFAAAPPAFAALLSGFGPGLALWIALAASLAALVLLLALRRHAPDEAMLPPAGQASA